MIYLLPLCPNMNKLSMNLRYYLLVLAFCVTGMVCAQRGGYGKKKVEKDRVAEYMDSLTASRQRIDSLVKPEINSCYSQLFIPLTFYHEPAARFLRLAPGKCVVADSLQAAIDQALMHVYLNRPDLVRVHESHLESVGAPIVSEPAPRHVATDIVKEVAPVAIEPTVAPMDILVTKPNFWTFRGDYYLQFLQNYVSDNWYKGGESNYSLLGSVTMQANYNNKQKVKWENKLEMRFGFQSSRSDSLHRYKTTEDLIRLTSKLGLQASKRWYYTLQLLTYTQFTHSYRSNDPTLYSDFLAPLNVNLSLGMDYSVDWQHHRLKGNIHLAPLAYNMKYTRVRSLSSRLGIEDNRRLLNDFGSEFTVDLSWTLMEDLTWRTRLYGYTTYERVELEWENTFVFQFNRFVSAQIFLYPRFDDGVARDSHHGYLQFKEYASIGFNFSF